MEHDFAGFSGGFVPKLFPRFGARLDVIILTTELPTNK
jgi:hypothetical protein